MNIAPLLHTKLIRRQEQLGQHGLAYVLLAFPAVNSHEAASQQHRGR
jgi:hypothetical protein